MTSGNSLNKPPSYNGDVYNQWKENIRIFIEGMNRGILKVVKEGIFVLVHEVNGVMGINIMKMIGLKNKYKKCSTI